MFPLHEEDHEVDDLKSRFLKVLPKQPQDIIATGIFTVIMPIGFLMHIFWILPTWYPAFGEAWTIRVVSLLFLAFNVYYNWYKMCYVGPSGRNSVLPNVVKPGFRYCHSCHMNSPPRAYHCPVCDICVFRRDHHCSFGAVCVGHFNQRYTWDFLWTKMDGPFTLGRVWQLCLPHLALVARYVSFHQFLYMVFLAATSTVFLFSIYLFSAQLFCLYYGQTRIEYLLDVHAYQLGLLENLKQALGTRWYLIASQFVTSSEYQPRISKDLKIPVFLKNCTYCHNNTNNRNQMDFIQIRNDEGISAKLLAYGGSLVSLEIKDKDGKIRDIVLGFDTKDGYIKDNAYMGRTIGRIANRVKDGHFVFKGKDYKLPINDSPHNHHGGPDSTAFHEWEVIRSSSSSVTFRTNCSEEVDGFPGDAKIDLTYTLNDRNQLVVEHYATCLKEGVLALAHHPYFNLDGSEDVSNHEIQVKAGEYLPSDQSNCPTGGQLSVKGTLFDLREPQKLEIFKDSNGVIDIDQDLVISPAIRTGSSILSLSSEKSGIKLDISTSYPIVHLYGGKFLNEIGKGGEKYGPGKGIAIEAQFHSAALNYSTFPDVPLVPGVPYVHEVIYTFSHL